MLKNSNPKKNSNRSRQAIYFRQISQHISHIFKSLCSRKHNDTKIVKESEKTYLERRDKRYKAENAKIKTQNLERNRGQME
jgi:hypothetical protein